MRIIGPFLYALLLGIITLLPGCGVETSSDRGASTTPPPPFPPSEAILAYDSNDTSIVLRSSLTSPDSITTVGGSEEATSANLYDPQLGMQPRAFSSGVPGCRFTAANIPALASLPQGQLSIEVQRPWLSIDDPDILSTGATHSAIEYLLSFSSAGKTSAGKLYMETDQYLTWLFHAGEGSRRAKIVNTKLSPSYARMTISWTQSNAQLFVNGLLIGSLPRIAIDADNFSQLFIGNFAGTTDSPFTSDYYVRNLIVARKPVQFTTPPLLDHVMLMGDSFAAGQPFFNVPDKYDGTIANNILRDLALSDLSTKKFSVYSNGGGKIQDSSNDPLESDIDGSGKPRDDALRDNPSIVIFVTGGNDVSIYDRQTFTTDLHDHIEAFLGVNGHTATTTQKVIVTTTVSHALNDSSTVHEMADIMRALPVWWDANYPERAGAVHVVDAWSLFGGNSVDSELFLPNDPIHPAPAGNLVYGQAITDKILELLGL